MISTADYWFTINVLGKSVMIDSKAKPARYPMGFPNEFQASSEEDYDRVFCSLLCEKQTNISWSAFFNQTESNCSINVDALKEDSGSPHYGLKQIEIKAIDSETQMSL